MPSNRTRALALAVVAFFAVPAAAEEGMWMPQQIPALAGKLRAMGFEGDPQAFADLTGQPMGAIVSLGGCSASFVSPDGLVITNHHCVTGALQYNSTPERNLLNDGFLAASRDREVSAGPGSRLYVTTRVAEVTDDLNARLTPELTDRGRFDVVDRWVKERTAACEKSGSRCRVAPFFGGLHWFEIEQMEIRDVRLVAAPPKGIGNYGGETDNWRWPRHVGDFSFYRAYVSPDGKPVPYAKDNVPYHPKRWLKVSPKGASPGDLVIVAGYPGYTERLQTYAEIAETVQWDLPRSIRRAEEQLALVEALAKRNPEVAIKVESRRRGFANGLTKNRGVLEGLVKGGVLDLKKKQQASLEAWIQGTPDRAREFGDVLAALEAQQTEAAKTRDRDAVFGEVFGGSVLGSARTLYQLAVNRPRPDFDREAEYQERNWQRIRDGLERLQRTLDPTVDRAFLRYALVDASNLPSGERIEVLDRAVGLSAAQAPALAAKAIDAFLDRFYAGTKLFDAAYRLSLFDKSDADLRATGDTAIALASALAPFQDELREVSKTRQGARYRLVPRYMRALLGVSGGLVAPDANGTLRVTYGRVAGGDGRDGIVYKPQTTLGGVVEKHTDQGEFDAPDRLLDAARALRLGKTTAYVDPALHDVPVDFLSTVDTTGGNSGSATLNARGELCGLLFDGVYETVASDILFDPVRTRSIHVDSRYVLFVLSEVMNAPSLLEEMK